VGQRFDLSLKGPRRSFIVESFTDIKRVSINRTLAGFVEGSRVQIVDETTSQAGDQDGPPPSLQVPNIAGIEQALAKLNEFLEDFQFNQTEPSWGKRSCGVILHGGRGMGKSLILQKISETGWGKVFHVDTYTKPSSLRDIFKNAIQAPSSIILIHELDLLVPNIERPLCEELDRIADADNPGNEASPNIVIITEASKLSEIPSSLRKRGRLNTEILIPVPDADGRRRILRSLAPPQSSDNLYSLLDKLGDRTHAYTGEDLALLLDKACEIARRRLRGEKSSGLDTNNNLTKEDIDSALLAVRPSAMHDITLRPPTVHWHEIGGQQALKKALRRAVETPLKYPSLIRRLGASPKKGLLLYGPPGCSKTLSAQAMATETGLNFFAVKGAELLNMYVGESERAVREVFARARAASPSIVFFDEIESIGAARQGSGGGGGARGGGSGGVNVLTTLLNEMDGIEALKGVIVLAATNKPEILDLALLRPGRFDDLLYVAPPDLAGREEILEVRRKRMDWEDGVDVHRLAVLMEGYSGAEIVGICNAAVDRVVDRALDTGDMDAKVGMEDFEAAVESVKRQITPELIEGYKRWAKGIRNDSW
jgi:AAA family ATPase